MPMWLETLPQVPQSGFSPGRLFSLDLTLRANSFRARKLSDARMIANPRPLNTKVALMFVLLFLSDHFPKPIKFCRPIGDSYISSNWAYFVQSGTLHINWPAPPWRRRLLSPQGLEKILRPDSQWTSRPRPDISGSFRKNG